MNEFMKEHKLSIETICTLPNQASIGTTFIMKAADYCTIHIPAIVYTKIDNEIKSAKWVNVSTDNQILTFSLELLNE